jgi:serine/threonine protein kinase
VICCLHPDCHNPPHGDDVKFCSYCGTELVVLRQRYKPVRSLGGGGFGKTFVAEDVDNFNENCVIKLFAPQASGSSALKKAEELFNMEAQRLKQLGEYPQIPRLLAYFREADDLYLVQEFIDGQNLLQELQQGCFDEDKIRQLMTELLAILQIVHQHKVIHRDIKPENIIRRSSDRKLFLIDFGASKQRSNNTTLGASNLSSIKPGTIIGSFGYVPMEQMQLGEAYISSDLYSLGVTCFHLLTNKYPFYLWSVSGYSWVETWKSHLTQALSPVLEAIIDKLLQQDYRDRYQSSDEVLEALKQIAVTYSSNPQPQVNSGGVKTTILNFPNTSNSTHNQSQIPSNIGSNSTSENPINSNQNSGNNVPTSGTQGKENQEGKISLLYKLVIGGITILIISALLYKFGIESTRKFSTAPQSSPTVSPTNIPTLDTINYENLIPARNINAHTDRVFGLAVTPDGKTLVSGGEDKTIKIWDFATGKLQKTLTSHQKRVTFTAITPNGKTLVSASSDGTIKIWDLSTYQLQKTLEGHTDEVNKIAINYDGTLIVSAGKDKKIKIWDLETGKLLNSSENLPASVTAIAFSPKSNLIVSGDFQGKITIWKVEDSNLKLVKSILGNSLPVWAITINEDETKFITGSNDKNIKIWDLQTGYLETILDSQQSFISSLINISDRKILISGGGDSKINIWDMNSESIKKNLIDPSGAQIISITITPDKKNIISANNKGIITIWESP